MTEIQSIKNKHPPGYVDGKRSKVSAENVYLTGLHQSLNSFKSHNCRALQMLLLAFLTKWSKITQLSQIGQLVQMTQQALMSKWSEITRLAQLWQPLLMIQLASITKWSQISELPQIGQPAKMRTL